MENLDPIKYPILSAYPKETIRIALEKLREKYPQLSEEECLKNLESEEEAGRAYDRKAKELYGEYAKLNFA